MVLWAWLDWNSNNMPGIIVAKVCRDSLEKILPKAQSRWSLLSNYPLQPPPSPQPQPGSAHCPGQEVSYQADLVSKEGAAGLLLALPPPALALRPLCRCGSGRSPRVGWSGTWRRLSWSCTGTAGVWDWSSGTPPPTTSSSVLATITRWAASGHGGQSQLSREAEGERRAWQSRCTAHVRAVNMPLVSTWNALPQTLSMRSPRYPPYI